MDALYGGEGFRPGLNIAVGRFVSEQLWGEPGRFERHASMGVFHRGEMIAGIVYHNWQPEAGVIEISGAATDPRWLARPVLRKLFALPFEQYGCQLVVFRISPRNEHLLRMTRRFGFAEYRIPRLRGRDEDEIVATLTDDQWRAHPLLRDRHG